MDIALIFSLIFFIIVALGALRGWRRGKKKSWQNSLVRLIVILISAIIAIFVSKSVASTVSDILYRELAAGTLPEETMAIFEDLPSAHGIILAFLSMILAPILFYPINWIIKLILKIFSPLFVSLLTKLTKAIGNKSTAKAENASTADVTKADTETDITAEPLDSERQASQEAFAESGDEHSTALDSTEKVTEFTEEPVIEDEPAKKQKKQKKQKKSRSKEQAYPASRREKAFGIAFGILAGILGVFVFFAPIMGLLNLLGMIETTVADAGALELEDAEPVIEIVDSCTHNAAVSTVNALGGKLIFNSLTTFKVNSGKITLSKEAELLCTVAKTAMTISDEEKTAEEKSTALKDVIPAFEKSNIIPILLSEFLSGASAAWEANEDFCGISLPVEEDSAISELLIETLSVFKDSTPNTVKEDAETIINIVAVAVDHDIIGNMPEDPMDLLNNKALVSDLFYEVFENARLKAIVNSLINTGIEMMTTSINIPDSLDGVYADFISELGAARSAENADELKSEFGSIFNKYGIDITERSLRDFTNSVIKEYGGLATSGIGETDIKALLLSITVNTDSAEKSIDLSTETAFIENTLLVTTATIKTVHEAPDVDSRTEANAIAEVFASVSDVTSLFSGEGVVIADTVKTLGNILDKFAACQNIGKKCVDNLIVALLQSDMVYDAISMDKVTATHFANSIIKGTESNKSYAQIMSEIADVIDKMTEVSASNEFDNDGIKSVISTLTPETATALKHIVSGKLVDQIGFSGGSSEGVSDILSSVFDNIAFAKQNGMDDATYAAETEKIANLLDTTMTITNDSNESIDVKTYVNSAMDSQIISNSLTENVYKDGENPTLDPLGTNMSLGENEKESLVSTLQTKIDEAADGDKEKTEKNAVAIAAYLNVSIEIVNGNVQIIEP